MTIELLLVIFGLLLFKHYTMSYIWRTPTEVANCDNVLHPSAYVRAGKQILGSLPIYAMATISPIWLISALVVEFVAVLFSEVYHGIIQRAGKWDSKLDRQYWHTFGLKETFQMFICLIIITVLVLYSPQGFQGW